MILYEENTMLNVIYKLKLQRIIIINKRLHKQLIIQNTILIIKIIKNHIWVHEYIQFTLYEYSITCTITNQLVTKGYIFLSFFFLFFYL